MEQWKPEPEPKRGSWLRSHIKAPSSNAPPRCVTFKRFLANETRSLQGSRRCLKTQRVRIYIPKQVTCFCEKLSLFQELEARSFSIHPFNIPASPAWRVMGCVTSRQFITDSTQTIIRTHTYGSFRVASYCGRRSEDLEGIHTGRRACKLQTASEVSELELNRQPCCNK